MKNQKRCFTTNFLCFSLMFFLFWGFNSCNNKKAADPFIRTVAFDEGWRFLKDSLVSAENPDFNDSNWRILNVPHDWSIEDLPNQIKDSIVGPFDKSSVDKMSSGYLVGGTGWYRKSFTINEADKDKIAFLQFDGVYMNADVWLNGKHLGFHPYGYTPFYYNITPFLNPIGQSNVVAVRVKNEGQNSRWYSGSGIYRHVWFTLVNPVHIDVAGGLYVTTPTITENSADVKISATLVNSESETKDVVLQAELFDSSGHPAGTTRINATVSPGQKNEIVQSIQVKNPELWSIDNPNLYQAKVSVLTDDKVIDFSSTSFGIRDIKINAQEGLTINGVPVDMIGGCYHHDNGPLGAASIDRAEERRIEILKKAGFNAIRTSHNPPSPATLDACDRLGMLVINEIFDAWETPKKPMDYNVSFREWWQRDVESWVKRDRNHPSVIIWSIGNEIRETFDTTGFRIARNLTEEIRRHDNSRFVTECFNDFAWMRGQPSRWDSIPEHMALFDLIGYNYAYKRYESDHEKYPDRVIVSTETNPPLALENYEMVKKHPYVIGYFVWTATDNIGEAGVGMPQLRDIEPANPVVTTSGTPGQQVNQAGNLPQGMQTAGPGGRRAGPPGGGFFRRDTWPVYTNYQGDIDLIGNRKVPSFYQHVVWGKSKIEMFVHRPVPEGKREAVSNWGFPDELKSWNWEGQEGKKFQVHVYTRSQLVKLELNGKPVGEQPVDLDKSITATFEVPYEPGTLVARCFDDGKETALQTLKTTGRPEAIRLVADRTKINASRNDLSYVMAEIIDAEGNIVPDADNTIVNFEITGKGKLAGVGSGDPRDMSSFQQPKRKTYHGICLAIIQPETTPGKIIVKATAEGLKGASLAINAR